MKLQWPGRKDNVKIPEDRPIYGGGFWYILAGFDGLITFSIANTEGSDGWVVTKGLLLFVAFIFAGRLMSVLGRIEMHLDKLSRHQL